MIQKSEEEWKRELSQEQYRVLREKGTERPFTGKYYLHQDKGLYVCAGCGAELFTWEGKFDSGCGWPSFSVPVKKDAIKYELDNSHGMTRVEIMCANCGGHLGHVFNDGPTPEGYRYCVNSVSIDFKTENPEG